MASYDVPHIAEHMGTPDTSLENDDSLNGISEDEAMDLDDLSGDERISTPDGDPSEESDDGDSISHLSLENFQETQPELVRSSKKNENPGFQDESNDVDMDTEASGHSDFHSSVSEKYQGFDLEGKVLAALIDENETPAQPQNKGKEWETSGDDSDSPEAATYAMLGDYYENMESGNILSRERESPVSPPVKNDKLEKIGQDSKISYDIAGGGNPEQYYPKYLRTIYRPTMIKKLRGWTSYLPKRSRKEYHDIVYTLDIKCAEAIKKTDKQRKKSDLQNGNGENTAEEPEQQMAESSPDEVNEEHTMGDDDSQGRSSTPGSPSLFVPDKPVHAAASEDTKTAKYIEDDDVPTDNDEPVGEPVYRFGDKQASRGINIADEGETPVFHKGRLLLGASFPTLLNHAKEIVLPYLPNAEARKLYLDSTFTLRQLHRQKGHHPRKKKRDSTNKHANSVEEFQIILRQRVSDKRLPHEELEEEDDRPWLVPHDFEPKENFPKTLFRVFDEKSKCKLPLVGERAFLSGAAGIPLRTWMERSNALSDHFNWGHNKPTAFISTSRSTRDIENIWAKAIKNREEKDRPSTMAVSVINPLHRLRKRFPIIANSTALPYYTNKLAFSNRGNLHVNEYLLPFRVSPDEIVGTWCWVFIMNYGGMEKFRREIAMPELAKHEEASKKGIFMAGGMRCPCCKHLNQEEKSEMEL